MPYKAFFVILQASLVLMFIDCRYGTVIELLMTVQISDYTEAGTLWMTELTTGADLTT
jgi:hypothetical protein